MTKFEPKDPGFSRRGFLQALAVSPLAFVSVGQAFPFGNSPPSNFWVGNPLKAMGQDALEQEATNIVQLFSEARLATLCTYYQLFWPQQPDGYTLSGLSEESADFLAINRDYKDRHRMAVLPHVAGVHAISNIDKSEASRIEQDAVKALSEWIDPGKEVSEFGFSRREAVEIFWQNAISTTIRNRDNWESPKFNLLQVEAARQCRFYLQSDFPELLMPAVLAYQFLLTFQRSLWSHGTTTASKIVDKQVDEIDILAKKEGCNWFVELKRIFKTRHSFSDLPSQITEVFIGDGRFDQDFFRYANLVRLASAAYSQGAMASDHKSPYLPSDRPVGHRGLAIFQSLGRDVSDFLDGAPLANSPRNGITTASAELIRDLALNRPDKRAVTHEGAEAETLATFQELCPLRQFDSLEQLRSYQNIRNEGYSVEALALALGGAQLDEGKLRAHWLGQTNHQITQLSKVKQLKDIIDSSNLPVEDVVGKHVAERIRPLRSYWQQYIEPMFRTTAAVPTGAPFERSQDRSTERAAVMVKSETSELQSRALADIIEKEQKRRTFYRGVIDNQLRLLQNDARTPDEVRSDMEENQKKVFEENKIILVEE